MTYTAYVGFPVQNLRAGEDLELTITVPLDGSDPYVSHLRNRAEEYRRWLRRVDAATHMYHGIIKHSRSSLDEPSYATALALRVLALEIIDEAFGIVQDAESRWAA